MTTSSKPFLRFELSIDNEIYVIVIYSEVLNYYILFESCEMHI